MKTNFLIFSLVLSFLICSCSIIQRTTATKTMDCYGSGVIQNPPIVDLDIKDVKVTGTASSSKQISIVLLKNQAVTEALKSVEADVLIEPNFTIENNGRNKKVSVTGFPATYKNMRMVSKAETELLNVGLIQKAYTNEPVAQKDSNTMLIIGSGILSISVVLMTIGIGLLL